MIFKPFVIACLLWSSCNLSQENTVKTPLLNTRVDKVIIRVPGKVSLKDDDLLMRITDVDKIGKITNYVNSQLSTPDWRSESEGTPQAFLHLFFYDNEINVITFGVGRDFFSISYKGYRTKTVTQEEKNNLLRLIGLTEEEYLKLVKDSLKPGPWKQ